MSELFADEDNPYREQLVRPTGEQQPVVKTKMVHTRPRNRYLVIAGCVLAAIVILVIGILIGFFSAPRTKGSTTAPSGGAFLPGVPQAITQDGDPTIRQKLIDEINPDSINQFFKTLTKTPHLAGTPADYSTAQYVYNEWKKGLDEVDIIPYDVLLSYPDEDKPNSISLYDGETLVHQSQLIEKIVRPDQNQSNVVPPFNAYSAPGSPSGDLVYVNYGRIEDFNWLKAHNIEVKGRIVIARYGKIFRGDKVTIAQNFGALGVILYSDPADYAVGTTSVYPDSWWLPGTGVQRGTTFLGFGDPLTPGYPAINSSYKIPVNESGVPNIPVHPIGYDDALQFLRNMKGDAAPPKWHGKLNITYKLGPGFVKSTMRIQMNISTHNEVRTTYNVIGYIRGRIEPDRYVLLGNHRDAWVFGAVDPSSGTASLMEAARAFGAMKKSGWRPRRTIVFCSWGAEEFGLLGSTEWVENYFKNLGNRAVAYLNIDIAVQGNFSLRGRATPLLYKTLYAAAQQIPNPVQLEVDAGRKTVYDTWLHNDPKLDKNMNSLQLPRIGALGSGSDFAPFLNRIGIPCLDVRYTYNKKIWPISSYPLYHSVYETYHLMATYMDPGFKLNSAVTRVWSELARLLADTLILPMNVTDYAMAIRDMHGAFVEGYGQLLNNRSLHKQLDYMKSAVDELLQATDGFNKRLENINRNDPMAVRMVNDQIMQLERAFIDPEGLPGRPLMRHLIYAPSSQNSYAGASFPGLVDALFEIEKDSDPEKRWAIVEKHLSVVTFTLQSAAITLAEIK